MHLLLKRRNFQLKKTDPKYLIQLKGFQLNGKWIMNLLWHEDVIEQYFSLKKVQIFLLFQNIEQFRKLQFRTRRVNQILFKNVMLIQGIIK
ncbi:unnamed protein product [Paramecium primaurelia]|uniref:Uncharacterized protein n=1 Tax=Paramecium primaurelia TaxID=5886 RepID=A0A8S1PIK4_PARPR|nr:unnamed protein product [Paramecium primaurelia]